MQDERREKEQQNAQPGSMASYNNREDNRPGRIEETEENEDALNIRENSQPGEKATQKKDEKKA